MSNIKLSGDGIGENKVVFDRLLDKWNEIFTRQGLVEAIESVETRDDNERTFTAREFSIKMKSPLYTKIAESGFFKDGLQRMMGDKFTFYHNNLKEISFSYFANGKTLDFDSFSNSSLRISVATAGKDSKEFRASVSSDSYDTKTTLEELCEGLGKLEFFDNMVKFILNLENREQEFKEAEEKAKDAQLNSELDDALGDL